MKAFIIFALVATATAQYGLPHDDFLRTSYDAPIVRSSYETPVVRVEPTSYEIKSTGYEAPVIRSSYEAPVVRSSYEAPVVRVEPTSYEIKSTGYEAPVIRSSYEAPVVRSTYEAPVVKVEPSSYEIKSSDYETPIVKSSYGYTETVRKAVPIMKYVMNNDNYGSYTLETLSGDGIAAHESGALKNLGGKEGPVNVKTGSYSYTAPNGKVIETKWTADELGFRVEGEHLPTAPPMSAAMMAALMTD